MAPDARQQHAAFIRQQVLINRAEHDVVELAEPRRQRGAGRRKQEAQPGPAEIVGTQAREIQKPLFEIDADQLARRQEAAHHQGGSARAAAEIEDPLAAELPGIDIAEHFVADGALDVPRVLFAHDLVADIAALGGVDLEDQLGWVGGDPAAARAGTALVGFHSNPVAAVGEARDAQAVAMAQEFREVHGGMMPTRWLRCVAPRRR